MQNDEVYTKTTEGAMSGKIIIEGKLTVTKINKAECSRSAL